MNSRQKTGRSIAASREVEAGLAKLLNEGEVREILGGISRPTLSRLTKCGEIRTTRIGSRVLYHPCDVQDFIDRARGEMPHAT